MVNRALLRNSVCGAVILAAALPLSASSTTQMDVDNIIHNRTGKYLWVDVSWSTKWKSGWSIESAFCVDPQRTGNHTVHFSSPEFGPQIRVRAEVKQGDCRSRNITVVSGEFKDIGMAARATLQFTVTGPPWKMTTKRGFR